MKLSFFFIAIALSVALCFQAFSEDKHDHKSEGSKQEKSSLENESEEGHSHEEGEEHAHAEGEEDGHGHGEEANSSIGPDKGITEKSALGMKLSPEAIETIKPQSVDWNGGAFTIPYKALVRIKDAKSIFRLRDGWYKRVPASVLSRAGQNVTVQASDLKAGDKIIISGLGFLRMAEVIAEEGASHGHSH